jgi:hypothetical protein
MDHVHIAPILIIVLVTVNLGDNSIIFHASKWTPISPARNLILIPMFTTWTEATILISHDTLKPREIMLPNTMNYTILNIRSLITNLSILHPKINRHHNHHWKTLSKPSCISQAKLLVTWRMLLWQTPRRLPRWKDKSIIWLLNST